MLGIAKWRVTCCLLGCLLGLLKPSQTPRSVYQRGSDTAAYLLQYVDDIVLTASSTDLLQRIMSALQREFTMKDLGDLHHFLSMHVQRSGGLLLSQCSHSDSTC